MTNILDIGKQGAQFVDVDVPKPGLTVEGMARFTAIIDRLPTSWVETEVGSGIKRDVEVNTLLLARPQIFGLVREIALYEPIVFAQQGKRRVMGILSPNFDEAGLDRLPSIKVLPLQTPYPLLGRGNELLPDARMATMLAGSAHAEGAGSGGHDRPVNEDYEHKLTFIGAISLGRDSIMSGGRHANHAQRAASSVAAGMTNGSLGNVFQADTTFNGYGAPLLFPAGQAGPGDKIFIPKSFLHNEAAYGVSYEDAARIVYGAGLQILHNGLGRTKVSDRLQRIAENA